MRQQSPDNRTLTKLEQRYITQKNRQINKIRLDAPKINEDIQKLSKKQKQTFEKKGNQILSQSKVAILIFAGGMGSRAEARDGKQFISFGSSSSLRGSTQNPGCLFDLVLKETLKKAIEKRWNAVLYVLCNKANRNNALDRLQQIQRELYPSEYFDGIIPVYFCFQPEMPALSLFGLQNIYVKSNKKLCYPSGQGQFLNSSIYFDKSQMLTLREHIEQISEAQYLYGVGVTNLMEKGIDPVLLGYLNSQEKYDMVFKCVEPQFLDTPYYRASIRHLSDKKKQWVVMEFKNLAKICDRIESVQKSPVWCDNFVVKIPKMLSITAPEGIPRDRDQIKYQFHQREIYNNSGKIKIIVGESLLSRVLMNRKMVCKGLLYQRQQFKPLITKFDFQSTQQTFQSNSPIKSKSKRDQRK